MSLRRESRPTKAVLVVLALSERCEEILRRLALPDLVVVPLSQLEQQRPHLLTAKANRKIVEYFFTLTPWLIQVALETVPQAKRATYLDSDLFFFHSPGALWHEINNAPIAMVEHRFSPNYEDKIIYGRFNVGWNTFDRSPSAQAALRWWAEACLDWCYDRVEGEKFADQGYLTQIHHNFNETHILQYPGINLAEYNLDRYQLILNKHGLFANKKPVIYWHMHSLIENKDGSFQVLLRPDLLEHPVINWAHRHYIETLQHLNQRLINMGLPVDRGNARYPQLS